MERIGNDLGKTDAVLQGRLYRGIVHFLIGEFDVASALFDRATVSVNLQIGKRRSP